MHLNRKTFNAAFALIATLMTFSAQAQDLVVGYENKPFDSPEGWAMAHTLSTALNLGSGPAEDLGLFKFRLEAELSSIPHLSTEQQQVGFGGYKPEDLNKSPVFGRARVSVGLPAAMTVELSWTPPLEINGSKPHSLFGLALERAIFSSDNWQFGGRIHAVRGHGSGDVSCSRETASFEPGSEGNPYFCNGPSVDRIRMNQEGAELMLSGTAFDGRIQPFFALATTRFRPFVKVEAPIFDTLHYWELESRGTVETLTIGARFTPTARWKTSAAFSYTPLSVNRPFSNNGRSDDFWSVRVSAAWLGNQ